MMASFVVFILGWAALFLMLIAILLRFKSE